MLTSQRQPGQGGSADPEVRDLRAQLLEAEAAHFSKTGGKPLASDEEQSAATNVEKRRLEAGSAADDGGEETLDAKRRRVLEETRDIDADSEGSASGSSGEDR